jgi:UDP-N-acetylmuramoyl-tripeptide--D-alanyl-D-alanine ligase
VSILWHPQELKSILDLPQMPSHGVTGVSFDSRAIQPGDLFVAFKGPLKDAYDFVEEAFRKGAVHALVERPHKDPRTLLVPDSFQALEALAYGSRKRSQGRILAITGSFGKTTAKECAAHILKAFGSVTATERSFNNHWGVPLSMAKLRSQDAFGVFELGMNHAQELSHLTHYVRPHVALITTVAGAHQAHFKSIEDIARAKSEIFLSMEEGSIGVLPRDNPYYEILVQAAQKQGLKIITFGTHPEADCHLESYYMTDQGTAVTFTMMGGQYSYHLKAYGEHLVQTTLGVMASLSALGVNLERGCQKVSEFSLLPGRGQSFTLPWQESIITIVDESYNAGPESMTFALKAFGSMALIKGKKWAVLGDMLELGDQSQEAHKALAVPLVEAGIDGAFLFGPAMKHLQEALPAPIQCGHYTSLESLYDALCAQLGPEDGVLIKGSRGQRAFEGRMSIIIDFLKGNVPPSTSLSA